MMLINFKLRVFPNYYIRHKTAGDGVMQLFSHELIFYLKTKLEISKNSEEPNFMFTIHTG